MNKNNVAISVLLPVYNAEKYIRECIESILIQDAESFEVVIVDDCSTDGSFGIIESINDPRIILIRNEINLGITGALSVGLKFCRGEFIARADADDVMLAGRLSAQCAYLNLNSGVLAVGGQMICIDENGTVTGRYYSRPTQPPMCRAVLIGQSPINHPTVMFRKRSVMDLGGYLATPPLEDVDLWMRLSKVGELANIESDVTKYRIHSQSITEQSLKKKDEIKERLDDLIGKNAEEIFGICESRMREIRKEKNISFLDLWRLSNFVAKKHSSRRMSVFFSPHVIFAIEQYSGSSSFLFKVFISLIRRTRLDW